MPVYIGRLADFEEGKPIVITAGGRDLAVVRWKGRVFALRDVCPHQSCSLAAGWVRGRFTSDVVGDISVLDDEPMLVCPWHAWGFRLDTGECTVDASLRVKRYDVVVEDERVFVNLPAR